MISEFVPWQQILVFIEAIVRVYNRYGRRDNIYKARIKILVKAEGAEVRRRGATPSSATSSSTTSTATRTSSRRPSSTAWRASFVLPAGVRAQAATPTPARRPTRRWPSRAGSSATCTRHRLTGYRAVTLSLKRAGQAPGDATADQMDAAADLADRFSHGELRVTHDQNLLLPWVRESDLHALWQAAREASFATPNIGLLTDMIACPGGDFCALANARSIPIAAAITERFDDLDELYDIGDIDLHISGCINSCGHHHSGHIGILGVDKDGSRVVPGHARRLRRLARCQRRGGARQGDRPVVRGRRSARRDRSA